MPHNVHVHALYVTLSGDVANENRNQLRLPPPHPPPLPTSPSTARPRPLVSYKVRCLHDGRRYRATFATSEVDKVSWHFLMQKVQKVQNPIGPAAAMKEMDHILG